jgi:ribose transport system substrate-binding protein
MSSRVKAAIVVAVALAAAGCSSSSGGSTGAGGQPSGAATGASKAFTVTLIKGVNGDPFYVTMSCGAQKEATRLGAKLTVVGGDSWAADVQTPVVNSVISAHPDAVLIAPNDKTAMLAPLQAVVKAGIKLVIVDTGLDDQSMAESVISSDNAGGGKIAADALGEQIGGKGSVFVMNVKAGISTTDARAKGFIDEMKAKYPAVKVLETQYNADDPAKAASITTSVLSAHPDLGGVFATNVQGAEGTATGLKQAGKAGAVKVISYDAGPQQVQDLNAGTVQGLIAQDPYTEGVDSLDQAFAALSGKPVDKAVHTSLAALTTSNLDQNARFVYKDSC